MNVPVPIPSEVSVEFIEGMVDRMMVSYHKYGPVLESTSDHVSSLMARVREYVRTGNTEFLMDAANFAMIEFMAPNHKNAHFRPTDSDESPGRVTFDGVRTQESHAETRRRTGG